MGRNAHPTPMELFLDTAARKSSSSTRVWLRQPQRLAYSMRFLAEINRLERQGNRLSSSFYVGVLKSDLHGPLCRWQDEPVAFPSANLLSRSHDIR